MTVKILATFVTLILLVSCNQKDQKVEFKNNSTDIVSEKIAELSSISAIDSLDYVTKRTELQLLPLVGDSAIANYYYQTGLLYYRLSGFETALNYFRKAEIKFRDVKMELKATQMLANQAVLQELKGNYKEAINIYISTAEFFELHNDSASWASALGNIGVVYEEMGMADKAIYYDKLSLKIKQSRNDLLGTATSYNNIGVAFSELLNNADSAIYYYNKALDIYILKGDLLHSATAKNNIGMLYILQKKYKLASINLHEAYHVLDSLGNLLGKAISLRYIGELHFAKGDDKSSLDSFKKAMSIFKQINDKKSLMEMGMLMSKVYISMGLYAEATEMMQYRNVLSDSLMNNENKAIIAEMESKYQLKEKNKTIEVLLLEEELQKKRIRNLAVLIAMLSLIFVLIIVIYFFNLSKNKLKQKQLRLELHNYLLRIDELQVRVKNNSNCNGFSEEKLAGYDLSEREIDVLKLIARGYKNSEIAEKLYVSPNTIKSHIKNIYLKLDVKNRVEALNRIDI